MLTKMSDTCSRWGYFDPVLRAGLSGSLGLLWGELQARTAAHGEGGMSVIAGMQRCLTTSCDRDRPGEPPAHLCCISRRSDRRQEGEEQHRRADLTSVS